MSSLETRDNFFPARRSFQVFVCRRWRQEITSYLPADLSKFLCVVVGDKRLLLIVFGPPATPTPFPRGNISLCLPDKAVYKVKQFTCYGVINVSYRVFNCILVHFIPLPVFIFYSFTGIYILLIFFLYSILSTLFPCTLYGLIFPFLFLYFYSIFVYSFSLFSVPAWMGLYRRGWDYTAWSVFV